MLWFIKKRQKRKQAMNELYSLLIILQSVLLDIEYTSFSVANKTSPEEAAFLRKKAVRAIMLLNSMFDKTRHLGV